MKFSDALKEKRFIVLSVLALLTLIGCIIIAVDAEHAADQHVSWGTNRGLGLPFALIVVSFNLAMFLTGDIYWGQLSLIVYFTSVDWYSSGFYDYAQSHHWAGFIGSILVVVCPAISFGVVLPLKAEDMDVGSHRAIVRMILVMCWVLGAILTWIHHDDSASRLTLGSFIFVQPLWLALMYVVTVMLQNTWGEDLCTYLTALVFFPYYISMDDRDETTLIGLTCVFGGSMVSLVLTIFNRFEGETNLLGRFLHHFNGQERTQRHKIISALMVLLYLLGLAGCVVALTEGGVRVTRNHFHWLPGFSAIVLTLNFGAWFLDWPFLGTLAIALALGSTAVDGFLDRLINAADKLNSPGFIIIPVNPINPTLEATGHICGQDCDNVRGVTGFALQFCTIVLSFLFVLSRDCNVTTTQVPAFRNGQSLLTIAIVFLYFIGWIIMIVKRRDADIESEPIKQTYLSPLLLAGLQGCTYFLNMTNSRILGWMIPTFFLFQYWWPVIVGSVVIKFAFILMTLANVCVIVKYLVWADGQRNTYDTVGEEDGAKSFLTLGGDDKL